MKTIVATPKSVWERTSVQCLLRHKQSGGYYGRFTLHGKQKWFSLETDVFTVAKQRLPEKASEIDKIRGTVANVTAGKATMGELMTVYTARVESNPDFRPSTVASRLVSA